jgi:hypothetical protein
LALVGKGHIIDRTPEFIYKKGHLAWKKRAAVDNENLVERFVIAGTGIRISSK